MLPNLGWKNKIVWFLFAKRLLAFIIQYEEHDQDGGSTIKVKGRTQSPQLFTHKSATFTIFYSFVINQISTMIYIFILYTPGIKGLYIFGMVRPSSQCGHLVSSPIQIVGCVQLSSPVFWSACSRGGETTSLHLGIHQRLARELGLWLPTPTRADTRITRWLSNALV